MKNKMKDIHALLPVSGFPKSLVKMALKVAWEMGRIDLKRHVVFRLW